MRMIDADKVIADAKSELYHAAEVARADIDNAAAFRWYWNDGVETVIDLLETAPTIDPVKCGKWVEKSYEYYVCSACGEPALCDEADTILTDYCPNCGAKVEEKK